MPIAKRTGLNCIEWRVYPENRQFCLNAPHSKQFPEMGELKFASLGKLIRLGNEVAKGAGFEWRVGFIGHWAFAEGS